METRKFNLSNKITRKMVEVLLKNSIWKSISPEYLKENNQEKFERILNAFIRDKLIEYRREDKSVCELQDRINIVRDKILSEYKVSTLKKYVSEQEALNVIEKFKEFTFFLKYNIYEINETVVKEVKLPLKKLLDEMDNLEI